MWYTVVVKGRVVWHGPSDHNAQFVADYRGGTIVALPEDEAAKRWKAALANEGLWG